MKNVWFILVMIMGFSALGSTQTDNPKRDERVKKYRIAFLTESLQLTSTEAEGFWPIYNEFTNNREQVNKQLKSEKDLSLMNDNEVEEQIKRHFELKQRELDLERDLFQKLRKVLPARKIAKLSSAERDFREVLVQKLKEANQERRDAKQEKKERRNGNN